MLKAGGVTRLQPGIESLSDRTLALMKKGVTGIQNVAMLKWCAELGIQAEWNWLWGFPDEDPEEHGALAASIEALGHLRPPVGAARIRLDRFSPYWEHPEQYGLNRVTAYPAYTYVFGPSPEPLAYFFTFEYDDQRDPGTYTKQLREAILQWKRESDVTELISIRKSEGTIIIDTRKASQNSVLLLRGHAEFLLQNADAPTAIEALIARCAAALGDEGAARRAMSELRSRRLMWCDGSRCVSLPLDLSHYSPTGTGQRAVAEAVSNAVTEVDGEWAPVEAVVIGS